MRRFIAACVALGFVTSAVAAEPEGCDKFKWPIKKDRAALTLPGRATLASGVEGTIAPTAITLELKPIDAAALPMPPERKRSGEGFAGYLKVKAPETSGSYTLSMSSAVWIDVIQNGQYLKPAAFSGANGCDGIRKTMRFNLAAEPFVVQVSASAEASVVLLLRASD